MGEFVTASAFRSGDLDAVRDAALGFFTAHSCPADPAADAAPVTGDDVLFFAPAEGWTVVLWPPYFTELAAVEHTSQRLGILAATTRIYDGDYWSHALVHGGTVLDLFATMPGYFTDDAAEIARLRTKYAGRPEILAEAAGRPVEQLAPYLVHVDLGDDMGGKAFPDDEFELDDPWVFVDFWRRLGPVYPHDPSAYAARLRLAPGWLGKLPTGDPEL
ncbi:MAG TPA: hypothetical protein VF062_27400 [Candidatus Limnocylindrales bacterium]